MKFFSKAVLAGLGAIVVLLAMAPTLVSTPYGQKMAIDFIKKRSHNTFEAKKVELSWFGPQRLEGVTLFDEENNVTITSDALVQNESIFSILYHGILPNAITVENLNVNPNSLSNGEAHVLKKMLSDKFNIHVESLNKNKGNLLRIEIKSPHLKAAFTGKLKGHYAFKFTEDILVEYEPKNKSGSNNAILSAVIAAPTETLTRDSWKDLHLNGQLSCYAASHPTDPLLTAPFDISTKNNGNGFHVDFNIQGENVQLNVLATLTNDIWKLNSPLFASLNIDSLLKHKQAAEVFPILNEIKEVKNPLTLKVQPQGFKIPKDFNIKGLQADNIEMNTGTLVLKNNATLTQLAQTFNALKNDVLQVTFTPIYSAVRDGIVTVKRVDILLMEHFPVIAWGDINVIDDQLHLFLSVPSESVNTFFKVPLFNRKEMITLPIIGTLDNPTIDTASVEHRFANIAAKVLAGTNKNLKGALENSDNEPTIPEPTSEVPWLNQLPTGSNGKEKASPQKSSPEKVIPEQIKKGVNSLLDKLIK